VIFEKKLLDGFFGARVGVPALLRNYPGAVGFSPGLARVLIDEFSSCDGFILDPYCLSAAAIYQAERVERLAVGAASDAISKAYLLSLCNLPDKRIITKRIREFSNDMFFGDPKLVPLRLQSKFDDCFLSQLAHLRNHLDLNRSEDIFIGVLACIWLARSGLQSQNSGYDFFDELLNLPGMISGKYFDLCKLQCLTGLSLENNFVAARKNVKSSWVDLLLIKPPMVGNVQSGLAQECNWLLRFGGVSARDLPGFVNGVPGDVPGYLAWLVGEFRSWFGWLKVGGVCALQLGDYYFNERPLRVINLVERLLGMLQGVDLDVGFEILFNGEIKLTNKGKSERLLLLRKLGV